MFGLEMEPTGTGPRIRCQAGPSPQDHRNRCLRQHFSKASALKNYINITKLLIYLRILEGYM